MCIYRIYIHTYGIYIDIDVNLISRFRFAVKAVRKERQRKFQNIPSSAQSEGCEKAPAGAQEQHGHVEFCSFWCFLRELPGAGHGRGCVHIKI